MIIDERKLSKIVRENPGITPAEVASQMNLAPTTILRHARRMRSVTVERGQKGRGRRTRLWNTYYLPDHLTTPTVVKGQSSFGGPHFLDLDEIGLEE